MDYIPSDAMLRLRAEFLTLLEDHPLDGGSLRDKVVAYLPKHKADVVIRQMDSSPAFEAWFGASHEFNARIRYLGDKALGALEQILLDDSPATANARVKAAQMVLTLAGQKPRESDEASKKLDSALKDLSKAELQALMGDGTSISVSVKKPETIDVGGPNDGDS